jgi:hypothetical protein
VAVDADRTATGISLTPPGIAVSILLALYGERAGPPDL